MKLIEQIDIQPQNSKWLFDLDRNGLLIIDDSFQRNYVWLRKHQIKLIESILLGSPIPEIYIWNIGTDSDTGDTKYSIIDGQQRTGALFQFIKNDYALSPGSLDDKSEIYDQIKGKKFQNLDNEFKQAIWSYTFSVRLVRSNVNREQIVNMFLRLNSHNMTLNPEELRNAQFEGEFIGLASNLSELNFWNDNKIFGLADRRRMRDITFISNLLIFQRSGIDEEINSSNVNRIYDLYNEVYDEKEVDETRFKNTLDIINNLIESNSIRMTFFNSKVHLYTAFTYFYKYILINKNVEDSVFENYKFFIDNYNNEDELRTKFQDKFELIQEYKAITKEGINQKGNRKRRLEIMTNLVE
ncbi:MAG: DUF262 domain-containing protein [Weeksellaceae bacterium]|nr:DUF262 domain-containing protein [Weeksellaceae bacterium]